jgi:hypothetical protein
LQEHPQIQELPHHINEIIAETLCEILYTLTGLFCDLGVIDALDNEATFT